MASLNNERVGIETRLAQVRTKGGEVATFEQVRGAFLEAKTAQKRFLDASDEKKRVVLNSLLSNVKVRDQKIMSYQFKMPY